MLNSQQDTDSVYCLLKITFFAHPQLLITWFVLTTSLVDYIHTCLDTDICIGCRGNSLDINGCHGIGTGDDNYTNFFIDFPFKGKGFGTRNSVIDLLHHVEIALTMDALTLCTSLLGNMSGPHTTEERGAHGPLAAGWSKSTGHWVVVVHPCADGMQCFCLHVGWSLLWGPLWAICQWATKKK